MYAIGRPVEHFDMPTVRHIVHAAAEQNYRFSTLVQAIVESEQFRLRRGPSGAADEAGPADEITAQTAPSPL
jgi:hypothetical protein